jgi:hypothetical protein
MMVSGSRAELIPWGLAGDVDEGGAGEFGGGQDGEEDQVGGSGVVGAVNHVDGDMGGVAGAEDAFVAIDPLFGLAVDDIDDLLHGGMAMELVALPWRHDDADEHQFFGVGEAGSADPFVWAPRELFNLELIALDESEEWIGAHRFSVSVGSCGQPDGR